MKTHLPIAQYREAKDPFTCCAIWGEKDEDPFTCCAI
jgi:hypothetical protein